MRRERKTAVQTETVRSMDILHSPITEILKESERRHFDSGLENEDGREEEVEYLQRKLQLLCATERITISRLNLTDKMMLTIE